MAPFRKLLKALHASTPTRRGARSASVRIVAVTMFVLALVGGLSLVPKQQAHASAVERVLLLIHGYTDSCSGAFEATDNMNGTPNNITTAQFLQDRGWGQSYDPIVEVGYYSGDNSTSVCLEHTNDPNTPDPYPNYIQSVAEASNCSPYLTNRSGAQAGNTADPIEHLGCLLAWYIHDNFTSQNIPVYVLAHSMGGLIIRDAIGESGGTHQGFPSTLDVQRVVTVATPHGGVCCLYNAAAQHLFGSDTIELEDMLPGSSSSNFMSLMSGIQSPQAFYGTSWYLMAASDACGNMNGAQGVSCAAEFDSTVNTHNPNPDGDGIVQASSGLAMSGATKKVLYGVVDGAILQYTADSQTQYTHETNTCGPLPIFNGTTIVWVTACLGSPNYLNDGTLGPTTTKAWVCSAPNCTDSTLNFNDMNLGTIYSVPRSLQQIYDWLPTPAAPTPTPVPPTATPTVAPGACPQSPSDATCDNQDYIQQGCNAYGQSQTYSSSILYVQLYYSTNCQSNWTSAKTVASGYVLHDVWVDREETLAYAGLTYGDYVSTTSWYTNMVWAPSSPARSCATYENLSTGAISGAYCTPWSPVSTTCKNSPTDAHCTGQDYVVQGCNAYAQSSPAPVSNSIVSVTDYYSTNCESNWAVAKMNTTSTDWGILSVKINRGAVSGGLGATSATASDSRGDTTWWSPMVFAPSNPTQACVTYAYFPVYKTYTICTNMA